MADVMAAVSMTMSVSFTTIATASGSLSTNVNQKICSLFSSFDNSNIVTDLNKPSSLVKLTFQISSANHNKNQSILAISHAPLSFPPPHKNATHHHYGPAAYSSAR